jgi:hypothetical protein
VRVRALTVGVVAVLSTGACTSFADGADPSSGGSGRPAEVRTAEPDGALTLVPDTDPVAAAVSTSRALFERSQVVVVARSGDDTGTLLGASAAVGLGVPLLLEPEDSGKTDASASDAVATELDRLDAGTVLAVGATDGAAASGTTKDNGRAGHDVFPVPAAASAVAKVTGLDLGSGREVAAEDEAAAVAALDPGKPVALRPAEGSSAPDGAVEGSLPRVRRAAALADTVVLATGRAETVAGIATARAAGARVLVTGGATDPRASDDVVSALSEAKPRTVVALGAGLADAKGLDWKLATAAHGQQLPGGGQLLFPGRLLVALYGYPGSGALGVLGEQGVEASIQRARSLAAPYEALVDTEVVPAFEIIATVASSRPGPDGNYSAESEPADIEPWVDAAGRAGLYVVLDLQPGRTDFVTQAERYRSLLERPYVGLALDPEWRLGPGQVHLRQIGSVQIDEVNRVVSWLADLTREKSLPQKLLVLHQFQLRMIPGRERLDTSREELAVVIHADGQGSQGDKQATWRALHVGAPASVAWGWKNFYDEDSPMLTPEQTMAEVSPTPQLISYQ